MRSEAVFKWILGLALLLLLAVPGLVGLDQFATVDEPNWLRFSGNFLYALGQRDFEKTAYEYHPAVTTLWIGALALQTYFPEYRGQGQGYFEKDTQFNEFLAAYGKEPLELLKRSRMIAVVVVCLTLLAAFGLLARLFGIWPAFLLILLVGYDPFFLGHSRILNHEAMLAAFLLVAVLSWVVYFESEPRIRYVILGAGAAGLAFLTKSSSFLLLPVLALILLAHLVRQSRAGRADRVFWRRLALVGVLWLAIFLAVYVILWPGMWVNPLKMLNQVYGNAFSYALEGERVAVAAGNASQPMPGDNGLLIYLNALLWRTPPWVWLGLGLALASLLAPRRLPFAATARRLMIWFGILAALFVLLFGLARGRNSQHYILTSFVSLDIVAGCGLLAGLQWAGQRWLPTRSLAGRMLLAAGLLGLFTISSLPGYPYYYTYTNPIWRHLSLGLPNPNTGYGEGLQLAARYLAAKPHPDQLSAVSWYGLGPFSYFFPGRTINLLIQSPTSAATRSDILGADYLVIYDIQEKPRDIPADLLALLDGLPPVKTIHIHELEYIRIFKVRELPLEVLQALATQ